jgi:hypothetical protein
MALIKSAVKLIVQEHFVYRYSDPVLTLGVPEIYATHKELQQWFGHFGGEGYQGLNPSQVTLSTSKTAQMFNWVAARTFFQMLNLNEVLSTDVPGCEHQPDMILDMNNPFPEELKNRFNLVIDPGTLEHVFDQKTALTNITRALRLGGVVVHFTPIYSYNGGYYSINPNVLRDYYSVNGFNEIKAYVIMWDRYRPYTGEYLCYEYSEARLGARHALADDDQCRFTPHLLLFARKVKELPHIVCPQQTDYPPAFNANDPMPFELQYRITAMADRERTLHAAREKSFWT